MATADEARGRIELVSRRDAARILAGGAVGVATALVGARPASADFTISWFWCNKCLGLWLGPGDHSVCPAGGRHAKQKSHNYRLDYGEESGVPVERNWRQCQDCDAAYWAAGTGGDTGYGTCPVNERGHTYDYETPNYQITYNWPSLPDGQGGWRYCGKCSGLFRPKRTQLGLFRGVCPAGGSHRPVAGYAYIVRIWLTYPFQ